MAALSRSICGNVSLAFRKIGKFGRLSKSYFQMDERIEIRVGIACV